MSEWLKVMLGEIARKKEEREQAVEEQRSRDIKPAEAKPESNGDAKDTAGS